MISDCYGRAVAVASASSASAVARSSALGSSVSCSCRFRKRPALPRQRDALLRHYFNKASDQEKQGLAAPKTSMGLGNQSAKRPLIPQISVLSLDPVGERCARRDQARRGMGDGRPLVRHRHNVAVTKGGSQGIGKRVAKSPASTSLP